MGIMKTIRENPHKALSLLAAACMIAVTLGILFVNYMSLVYEFRPYVGIQDVGHQLEEDKINFIVRLQNTGIVPANNVQLVCKIEGGKSGNMNVWGEGKGIPTVVFPKAPQNRPVILSTSKESMAIIRRGEVNINLRIIITYDGRGRDKYTIECLYGYKRNGQGKFVLITGKAN